MCNAVINFNLASLSIDCWCHSHPNLQRALPGSLSQPPDHLPSMSLNLIHQSSLQFGITGIELGTDCLGPMSRTQLLKGL